MSCGKLFYAWEMTECGMKNDGAGEMRQEVDDGLISWLEENPNVEDEVTRSMEAGANLWSDLRDGLFYS